MNPDGWRYVTLSNHYTFSTANLLRETGKGLIPEAKLRRTELDPRVSKPLGHRHDVSNDIAKYTVNLARDDVVAGFKIFRAIPPSNKNGKKPSLYP